MKRVRAFATFTKGAVRKEDTLKTLRHLLRHVKGQIALFWDGLAQHRALVVQEFIARRTDRFAMVERFPAYAPELNPQEPLWASSKTYDMANFCPREAGDLAHRAKQSIRRIQRRPDIIRGALIHTGLFHRDGS